MKEESRIFKGLFKAGSIWSKGYLKMVYERFNRKIEDASSIYQVYTKDFVGALQIWYDPRHEEKQILSTNRMWRIEMSTLCFG